MAEQLLGDKIVSPRCDEGGAEISPTGMHGDRHVGRLARERRVGEPRIALRQAVWIVTALLGLRALVRVAQHGPGGVVELKIAAAGGEKMADRWISTCEVVEENSPSRGEVFADGGAVLPEMKCARRRDGYFRRNARVRFQEFEMVQHAMAGKTDLAIDPDRFGFGLHATELNTVIAGVEGHAVEAAEEIEM